MNWRTKEIVKLWQALENQRLNQHVFLNHPILKLVAQEHAADQFIIPDWRFDGVYAKHEWAFAAQELWANCFNAHYNVFDIQDTKYTVANPNDSAKPFTGAFAMQSVIHRNFGERIIQAHDFAKHLKSAKSMAKFFGGIVPMPSPELKQVCGECFFVNLENQYQGNSLNLLEEAMTGEWRGRKALRAFNNGKGLVELLVANFGAAYGDDCQELTVESVPHFLNFNKRAQLVAVMLHDRALHSNGVLPLVEDIDEVGPIADYEVPKALRAMGILRYSEDLAFLVDNWKEVQKDSQMEIEIRAATVAACCGLLEEINTWRENSSLLPINICHLDYWLWKMGKEAKHLRPHLTRTSAY